MKRDCVDLCRHFILLVLCFCCLPSLHSSEEVRDVVVPVYQKCCGGRHIREARYIETVLKIFEGNHIPNEVCYTRNGVIGEVTI